MIDAHNSGHYTSETGWMYPLTCEFCKGHEREVDEEINKEIEEGVTEAKAWVKGDCATVEAAFELLEEYSLLSPHTDPRCGITEGCICQMPIMKEQARILVEERRKEGGDAQ